MFKLNNETRIISWSLFGLGLIALIVSILYDSLILAFIGLSLAFWGLLLLYIRTESYVKQTILNTTITPSLTHLNQMLAELGYQGKGVYLPPRYFKDFETSKVFIAKDTNAPLPTPQAIQQYEDNIFMNNGEVALITPSGQSLLRLFEKRLATDFIKVDLGYLLQNLPRLFREDLEIAEDLEIEIRNHAAIIESTQKTGYDTIHVTLTNSIFNEIFRETSILPDGYRGIGCPLCSAIACAFAKATGEPVVIENAHLSPDGQIFEVDFRLLSRESKQTLDMPTVVPTEFHVQARSRFPQIDNFLIALGGLLLVWVGWIFWYDITVWGKDVTSIFLSSRTGEALGLGIGMSLLYYFLIGLALLLSGLIAHFRRRGTT